MRDRRVFRFRPGLERFEERKLLNASPLTAHAAERPAPARPEAAITAEQATGPGAPPPLPRGGIRFHGYLAFRVTNPKVYPYNLVAPFQQVLVQSRQPVPGQTYNVVWIVVKNGTAKTFTASDGLLVRLKASSSFPVNAPAFPVLTGDQTWKPNQIMAFYIVTKQYYPMAQVPGGFQFDMGGSASTLVPGPSGIILRLKYNPATFARTLNYMIVHGPGNQGGIGAVFGMPNTAINEFVNAATHRIDFGGHF